MNGIDNSMSVKQWEGIPDTLFTKIQMTYLNEKQKPESKFYYLHRTSKKIFNDNPLKTAD